MNKLTTISSLMTPPEICKALGIRARKLRVHQKMSRTDLAERSGVSIATIGRFETTGVATLGAIVKIAFVLGATDSLEGIFATPKYKTMREFIEEES
jgi:transcriptional regulator with XRE-family HTH domain